MDKHTIYYIIKAIISLWSERIWYCSVNDRRHADTSVAHVIEPRLPYFHPSADALDAHQRQDAGQRPRRRIVTQDR